MDTIDAIYVPCAYCGGLTGCYCPIPSAPMERSLYKTLQELRPSEKSTLALGLSHWLNSTEEMLKDIEYSNCSCSEPSPRTYDDRDLDHPDHIITLCTSCGDEIVED